MPAPPLARTVAVVVSVAIVAHLGAVLTNVLAAPSGPWPSPTGGGMATPPQLAYSLNRDLTLSYLEPLKLHHNYHFASNRPGRPGVWFEVRLINESGATMATRRFPDPDAGSAVRQRHALLALALADDQPVPPPAVEVIAPPGREVPVVPIWEVAGDRVLRLRPVPVHLVPRDRPVFRPSEWSLVLARSYVRHLCRESGAARGELIRHTREAIPPAVLFEPNVRADAFAELVSHFGEVSR
ncbi:MAG: hypothetical protein U0871_03535 [Gemmataceae bacterium]